MDKPTPFIDKEGKLNIDYSNKYDATSQIVETKLSGKEAQNFIDGFNQAQKKGIQSASEKEMNSGNLNPNVPKGFGEGYNLGKDSKGR
jgi:hypothetical protein